MRVTRKLHLGDQFFLMCENCYLRSPDFLAEPSWTQAITRAKEWWSNPEVTENAED